MLIVKGFLNTFYREKTIYLELFWIDSHNFKATKEGMQGTSSPSLRLLFYPYNNYVYVLSHHRPMVLYHGGA